MKVKDLIKKLEKFGPDDIVVMAGDEEGNYFNELQVIEGCGWAREDREIISEEDKADDDRYTAAVCLWP